MPLSSTQPPTSTMELASPMQVLPSELLIEIFVFCTYNDAFFPLTLGSVCKLWRETVEFSPRIWQRISMADEGSIIRSRFLARTWASKSKPLPFDVDINAECADMILPLLAPLLPSISRWRHFTLTGEREEERTLLVSEEPATPCTDLVINFADYDSDDDETEGRATFTRQYPTSDRYTMTVWVHEIPASTILMPLDFTNLTIFECVFTGQHTHPLAVIDFLSVCPQLEAFYFWGWTHEDASLTTAPPTVHLPNLKTMTLKSTCMTRSLLTSIHAPSLTQLYLAHLNVDFQLPPYYSEDGDSEDEANDPSQSPSSDHATGMGLRTFLSRSRPALRVLEMDFSDMRTKDFRFVFSRLDVLEEFLIVASDMSDKVINLLKPYESCDSPVRVRLPNLKKLALYNCQRLSGDAIVEAVSARAEYTDANASSKLQTVSQVEVVDCEGFTSRHGQTLAKTLGNRLRLH
ncbi:hypothetical protein BDN72DRAFT_631362 [Pluteus cervinus]|uniref:Uncharacterized protein n=1 Tax=Pluteus cervinus TaxID=181527 RepID=A0ACD3B9L1_9AGAR|nr:hypothetical protein BDN72DRAFT_631362 [Pluteus cervinus]